MSEELKQIRKLIKMMKKEGVLCLKHKETQISLSPQSLFKSEEEKTPEEKPSAEQAEVRQYTEEDILFWSAPGFDQKEVF